MCDVALSSTRRHDDHVDPSTQEPDEQLITELFTVFLC